MIKLRGALRGPLRQADDVFSLPGPEDLPEFANPEINLATRYNAYQGEKYAIGPDKTSATAERKNTSRRPYLSEMNPSKSAPTIFPAMKTDVSNSVRYFSSQTFHCFTYKVPYSQGKPTTLWADRKFDYQLSWR